MENTITALLNAEEDFPAEAQDETPAESQPENEEQETPLEGEAEETTEAESPESETPEDVPFHKNPRFRKLIEERNELREANKTFEERIAALETPKPQQETSIPDWFAEAFGADPNLYAKYRAHSDSERRQMRDELREEMRTEQKRASEESEKWEKWVSSQLESLEDDGLKFDRNELMKFASDYTVVGKDGNIDFRKAHELMEKVKTPDTSKSKERKKLGALGEPKGEPPETPKAYTAEDMRKTGWGQL